MNAPGIESTSSARAPAGGAGSVARTVVGGIVVASVVIPMVLVIVAAAILWRGAVDAQVGRGQQVAATTATLLGVARESSSAADLDVARSFASAVVADGGGDVEAIVAVDASDGIVLAAPGARFADARAALASLSSPRSKAGVVVDATVRERDRTTKAEAPAGRVLVLVAAPAMPWRIVLGLSLLGVALAAGVSLVLTGRLRRRALDPLEDLTHGLEAVAAGRIDAGVDEIERVRAPGTRPLREVDALLDAFDAMVRGVRERQALNRRLEQGVGSQVADDAASLSRAPHRQAVAVVVVDVRDFTPLQASLSPEVAGALVDRLLSTFVAVVERHGGHVERFLGDGLIALFGAPKASADHIERACACACDLEVAARHLVDESRESGIPRFVVGVGVAAGMATVGAVGPERRRIYQAMGDVPALARKVQQEAKNQGLGVLVTEEVYAAAADRVPAVTWKKLPPMVMRGVGMPVTLYRPERVARARDEVTALVDVRR